MKWQNNVGNSKKRANIITVLFAGFEFSLMVVGASGLGKSTMVNSMFLTDIYAEGVKEGGKEGGIGLVTSEPAASEQTLRVETHHRFVTPAISQL